MAELSRVNGVPHAQVLGFVKGFPLQSRALPLFVSLSLCLSVYLYLCISVSLSFCLSVSLPMARSRIICGGGSEHTLCCTRSCLRSRARVHACVCLCACALGGERVVGGWVCKQNEDSQVYCVQATPRRTRAVSSPISRSRGHTVRCALNRTVFSKAGRPTPTLQSLLRNEFG